MRSPAAADSSHGVLREFGGLKRRADVVKGGMSKPLFSPVLGRAWILTTRPGEKPPENGGKPAVNGEILH
jgi:hypothetical protein